MSDDEGMPSVCVALSFEGVLESLERPGDSVGDVEAWAEYLGVASERPQHEVLGFCTKHDVHVDFFPGPRGGKLETLRRARTEMGIDADRYLYVGRGRRDEILADRAGWDYMDADEAAENVGWRYRD
ncbi:MAG: hypothetical protein ACLFMT_06680 [Halobacteriales archaeon]